MTTDTTTDARLERILSGSSEATVIEQARAVAEVAAAVRVARDFPRDIANARTEMQQACSTLALAERAFWTLPRGKSRIEGSSVALARELMRCWGNADYGIRELRRDDAARQSEMQAWAWDQERNVRSSRSFIVPHAISVKATNGAGKATKYLDDLADIANNNNSVAARAVRETIFTILPVWFRVEAEQVAATTLQRGEVQPGAEPATFEQQAEQVVGNFREFFGVSEAQLVAYLALPREEWTPTVLGSLRVLGGELQRGEKRAADEFPAVEQERTLGQVIGSADES